MVGKKPFLGIVYDDFARFLFLHGHREASALAGELPEASDRNTSRRTPPLRTPSLVLFPQRSD